MNLILSHAGLLDHNEISEGTKKQTRPYYFHSRLYLRDLLNINALTRLSSFNLELLTTPKD